MKNNPAYRACIDIGIYGIENNLIEYGKNDNYFVNWKYLWNKEQRLLNKKLGLHVINRGSHNMARHKK